jgi:hypothetical protein
LQLRSVSDDVKRAISAGDADHLRRIIEFASSRAPGAAFLCAAEIVHLRQILAGIVDHLILLWACRHQLFQAAHLKRYNHQYQYRGEMQQKC